MRDNWKRATLFCWKEEATAGKRRGGDDLRFWRGHVHRFVALVIQLSSDGLLCRAGATKFWLLLLLLYISHATAGLSFSVSLCRRKVNSYHLCQ